jgi:cyclopropane fatty-acyl-phospholipid synthase-like methyltransferase
MIRPIISILTAGFVVVLITAAAAQTTAPMQQQHVGDHNASSQPGMESHHSFGDAEKWAKQFDDPQRDAWQKPDEVLDALHLQRTDKVADIGAGTGYFSVRIAKRVRDGKVFSVDIEPDMVRYLGERAHREHLSGLVPVLAAAGPNLPEPVDLVLVVDTYHHIENRTAYFAKLDTLVPNGRVAIWTSRSMRRRGRRPRIEFLRKKPSRNSTLLAIRWLPPTRSCRGSTSSCFSRRGRNGARPVSAAHEE